MCVENIVFEGLSEFVGYVILWFCCCWLLPVGAPVEPWVLVLLYFASL